MSEWNNKTEDIVITLADTCKIRRIHHLKQADRSRICHAVLSTAAMIIGPTAAVIAGQNVGICERYDTAVVTLSVLSGIVASVIKFGKFNEMHHLHKQASSSYHILETNAQLQIAREPSTRDDADVYIKWLQSKYEEVFTTSPLIVVHDVGKIAATDTEDSIDDSFDLEVSSNRNYMSNIVQYEMKRFENTTT